MDSLTFSLRYWIEEDRLAGGSCPRTEELSDLVAEFPAVISLLDDKRQSLYDPEEARRAVTWRNVPLVDHSTPTLGELTAFYETLWDLPQETTVYVHCLAGIGRTGTIAASYLVWSGMALEAALAQVDRWTGGLFSQEIAARGEAVRSLLRRFRQLFVPLSSPPLQAGSQTLARRGTKT